MTVLISKPQFNLREALTSLRRKIGLKGAEIMAAETVDDVYNVIGTNRNLIINGDFKISQRGTYTSATALTGANTYYLDRFKMFEAAASSSTFQHKLDQQLGDGSYANTLNLTATAANSVPVVQYHVEDYKSVWGRTFTLSFWYKSNRPWTWNIYNGLTQWHYQMLSTGGVWKRYSKTITLTGNGSELRFELYRYGAEGSLASGDYFEFTRMQLELGSVTTPFEYRTYQQELALCQRYYWQTLSRLGGGYSYDQIGQGFIRDTNAAANPVTIQVPYPVQMRTSPTVGTTNGVNFTCQVANTTHFANGGLSVWSSGDRVGWVDLNVDSTSGWSVGDAVTVYCRSGASDLYFSAEL